MNDSRDTCVNFDTTRTADIHDTSRRSRVWSNYWNYGALHSLQSSFTQNYEGSIRQFWNEVFLPLNDQSRVLDVGTGNGPLPAMLCERDASNLPWVDAIDLAQISPDWIGRLPAAKMQKICFHSGVSVEALPFQTGSCTLVTSQYGLEYAEPEAAIREITRVLQPSGSLAFIAHHANSRLAEIAEAEIAHVRWLREGSSLLDDTHALLPYLEIASRGGTKHLASDRSALESRQKFNRAMQSLGDEIERCAFPDLLIEARKRIAVVLERVLHRQADWKEAATALEMLREEMDDLEFRHQELLNHALDEGRISTITKLLDGNGFESVETAPIFHEAHVLGWKVRACMASSY